LRGLSGPWINKVYAISGKIVVGRVHGVDITIDDESISRRHAEIEVKASGVVVRDLGSSNGSMVNGVALTGEMELKPNDIVQFGVIEFEFEDPRSRAGAGPRTYSSAGMNSDGRPRKRMGLMVVAATLIAMVVVGISLKLVSKGDKKTTPKTNENPSTNAQLLQAALSECRSFSSSEGRFLIGIVPRKLVNTRWILIPFILRPISC